MPDDRPPPLAKRPPRPKRDANNRFIKADPADQQPAAQQERLTEYEDERPHLAPPRGIAGKPAIRRDPDRHEVREAVEPAGPRATEQRRRIEAARRKKAAMMRTNPFITDSVQIPIPPVPLDDPDWCYKFVRDMLPPDFNNPNGYDSSNMAAHQFGQLAYELVRLEMLPLEWRGRYANLVQRQPTVEGIHSNSLIRYRDLVLMRTDRESHDQQIEAWEYAADNLREAVTRDISSGSHQRGVHMYEDDQEHQRYVDLQDA